VGNSALQNIHIPTVNIYLEPASKQTPFNAFISFNYPLYLLLIGLALLLMLGSRVSKRKEWQPEPLSLETSKQIQGFSAVAIIIHHLSQELAEGAGDIAFLGAWSLIC